MDERITKRLHISGLTPNISPAVLSQQLSNFGTVTAVDGFGLVDGNGDARKFGFVTIEATQTGMRKCLTLLSGSTYKGAKLRIAEAKPAFRERLAKERQCSPVPLKHRKREKVSGIYAEDMSLVTPENVRARGGGWTITPMGRIVRPVKMKPSRPLVLARDLVAKSGRVEARDGKVKSRKGKGKEEARARRVAIDMLKWGSVHLKGVFVDVESGVPAICKPAAGRPSQNSKDNGEHLGNDAGLEVEDESESSVTGVAQVANTRPPTELRPEQPPPNRPVPYLEPPSPDDIAPEISNSLDILHSLFPDDGSDWGGRESISDFGVEGGMAVDSVGAGERNWGDDMDVDMHAPAEEEVGGWKDDEDESDRPEMALPHSPAVVNPPTQAVKLKDLFAPREEEADFSLLGHLDLDLDLELDDEIPIPTVRSEAPAQSEASVAFTPTNNHQKADTSTWSFNPSPSDVLFFPTSSTSAHFTRKLKDPLTVAHERGWNWRDPSVAFYRTEEGEKEGKDAIRANWEEQKVELTRAWKRRWREAVKVRRRRGGLEDAD